MDDDIGDDFCPVDAAAISTIAAAFVLRGLGWLRLFWLFRFVRRAAGFDEVIADSFVFPAARGIGRFEFFDGFVVALPVVIDEAAILLRAPDGIRVIMRRALGRIEIIERLAHAVEAIIGTAAQVMCISEWIARGVAVIDDRADRLDDLRICAALDFLHAEGYIEVNSADVEYLCFDVFNGGSAQIDALMKNGDIYHIYLQPDDLTPTGFMLRTAEELDSHGWRERYDALFEAMRDHTREKYRGAQQAEYTANGVG